MRREVRGDAQVIFRGDGGDGSSSVTVIVTHFSVFIWCTGTPLGPLRHGTINSAVVANANVDVEVDNLP